MLHTNHEMSEYRHMDELRRLFIKHLRTSNIAIIKGFALSLTYSKGPKVEEASVTII